jgi:hypothetical protein
VTSTMKTLPLTLAVAMLATGMNAYAAGALTELELLSSAANAYAAINATALYDGADVRERVMTIPHGSSYGQSLHPSTDALKAMGYLPPGASGGDVSLEFTPSGCNKGKAHKCSLIVYATVAGATKSRSWPIRYDEQVPVRVQAMPVSCASGGGSDIVSGGKVDCRRGGQINWELVGRKATNGETQVGK